MPHPILRIVHTADWHLGTRRGPFARFDATDDQFAAVEQILEIARDRNAGLLLVAGDVFDAQPRDLPAITRRLANTLRPHLEAGLNVLLVPGNHDRREHFSMMHALLDLGDAAAGRLIVAEKSEVIEIQGVAIGVVPYPRKEMLEPYLERHKAAPSKNQAYGTAYADLIRALSEKVATYDGPAIACLHVNVEGVTTPSGHEITYDSDLRLGRSDLPATRNLAYVALGHIHQPQSLPHSVPCYYSGSADRLDWGECKDHKQVLVVDVPPTGPAEVEAVPLDATPYYRLDLTPENLDELEDRYPDLDRAITEITLTCTEADGPYALRRRLLELSPRCTNGVLLSIPEIEEDAPASLVERPDDVASTVRGYVEEVFAGDPDLEALKALAQDLLNRLEPTT